MPNVSDLVQIGFNPVQSKHLGIVADGVEGTFSALTATGNNSQSNAYQIVANYNQFTTVTSSANSAKLPTALSSSNGVIVIANMDADNFMALYPATGETLNNLSANAGIQIPALSTATCYRNSTSGWLVTLSNQLAEGYLYTPTLTIISNLDAVTPYECQYLTNYNKRVCTVSGQFDADATAAAPTLTQFRMSLPIASDFTTATQCGGVAAAVSSLTVAVVIGADTTNSEASFFYYARGTANITYFFTFTYRIL